MTPSMVPPPPASTTTPSAVPSNLPSAKRKSSSPSPSKIPPATNRCATFFSSSMTDPWTSSSPSATATRFDSSINSACSSRSAASARMPSVSGATRTPTTPRSMPPAPGRSFPQTPPTSCPVPPSPPTTSSFTIRPTAPCNCSRSTRMCPALKPVPPTR